MVYVNAWNSLYARVFMLELFMLTQHVGSQEVCFECFASKQQGCRDTYVRKLLANRVAEMTSTVCET